MRGGGDRCGVRWTRTLGSVLPHQQQSYLGAYLLTLLFKIFLWTNVHRRSRLSLSSFRTTQLALARAPNPPSPRRAGPISWDHGVLVHRFCRSWVPPMLPHRPQIPHIDACHTFEHVGTRLHALVWAPMGFYFCWSVISEPRRGALSVSFCPIQSFLTASMAFASSSMAFPNCVYYSASRSRRWVAPPGRVL